MLPVGLFDHNTQFFNCLLRLVLAPLARDPAQDFKLGFQIIVIIGGQTHGGSFCRESLSGVDRVRTFGLRLEEINEFIEAYLLDLGTDQSSAVRTRAQDCGRRTSRCLFYCDATATD